MPRAAKGITLLRLSPGEREFNGVIVSFSNDESRWFPGVDAMLEASEYADRNELRIRCISTPETIYRDLQGVRGPLEDPKARSGSRTGVRHKHGTIAAYMPEHRLLAVIGRNDLFEP